MRGAIHTVAFEPATTAADRSVEFSSDAMGAVAARADRSVVHAVMRVAQSWFRHKPSVELAEIVGCDERTARRYFAGDRTPDAMALMTLLRSPYGVRLVQTATRDLPAKEYSAFWSEMGMAVLRSAHRQELDED